MFQACSEPPWHSTVSPIWNPFADCVWDTLLKYDLFFGGGLGGE